MREFEDVVKKKKMEEELVQLQELEEKQEILLTAMKKIKIATTVIEKFSNAKSKGTNDHYQEKPEEILNASVLEDLTKVQKVQFIRQNPDFAALTIQRFYRKYLQDKRTSRKFVLSKLTTPEVGPTW